MKLGGQLAGIEDARALAQAIVDTVREPFWCSTRICGSSQPADHFI